MATATAPTATSGMPLRARLRAMLADAGGLAGPQAADMEIGVYNWTLARSEESRLLKSWANPRFCALYLSKARSVLANLDPGAYVGNQRLAQRVRDAEFKPHAVAVMPVERVFPERWQAVVEMKIRRDEYLTTARPAAMTDQFKCNRCHKRECSYMELQTRSCDEPMSLFIQCLACGNRWRMG